MSDEASDTESVGSTQKELDENYRCCCGKLHITTVTYIITFVSTFFIVSNLMMKLAGYSETAWDWELLFLVVDSIASVSLFYGVYSKKPAFIQPFVVLSIITTSFLILLATSMASAALDPNSYSGQDLELEMHKRLSDAAHQLSLQFKSVVSLVASVCFFFVLLSAMAHCWYVYVAVKCAKYFRELKCIEDAIRPDEISVQSQ
ncbi:unnamed protein product [Bursaphelenchus xylophilus]|uniref:(pine wood nematode) hypothetical protein n=1 Tax=Bursaphelenchus xylophilus TaxID=6326 RepID=A0A1I7RTV6_BURXY|nr:unnamed protein product [Bursaphelenchus xylophilus]CAG9132157.1 unnamed protein product [Bursaphelenchus xylophilus]